MQKRVIWGRRIPLLQEAFEGKDLAQGLAQDRMLYRRNASFPCHQLHRCLLLDEVLSALHEGASIPLLYPAPRTFLRWMELEKMHDQMAARMAAGMTTAIRI